MSTADQLSRDLDSLLNDLTCGSATALLRAYELHRSDETEAKERKDAVGTALKRHFAQCTDEHVDGEHGLEGGLTPKENADFDLIQMATQTPQDIITLALRGCLSVAVQQARGLRGKDPAVDRLWANFYMPRGGEQLYVGRRK